MQKWKEDPKLYNCKRDSDNKKKIDYYGVYIKEFLSADPVRDWESFTRCQELWEFLLEHREFRKPVLKVLDIGTKDGQFTQWLCEQGHDCTGIEIDPNYVEYAQSKGRNVEEGDVCNLKSKALTYDIVFAHHVLGLCPDYQKAIQEMVRVTKQNGIIIFLNQIPGNPKKHFSLVQSPEEVEKMLNTCSRHDVVYFDFWRNDEHVTILKRK